MRVLFLFLTFIISPFAISQNVRLNIDISDSLDCDIIIWDLDWDNKIIGEYPIYTGSILDKSTLSFYLGDYSIEYRMGYQTMYIYNYHIRDNYYYRYSIYDFYLLNYSNLTIEDSVSIRSTYVDF